MRLLNCHTLELRDFLGTDVPDYLILSHRWRGAELSYKDFTKGRHKDTAGYQKILKLCSFARQRMDPWRPEQCCCDWVWIDTCCIDKRSSAELSEAINSMYRWYAEAKECIVYMSDVPPLETGDEAVLAAFRSSDWFRRGWTLQELLASDTVSFCTSAWQVFGYKSTATTTLFPLAWHNLNGTDLITHISDLTRIQPHYLYHPNRVHQASIARRMSWAADRQTTRIEDQAYCLLGLFAANMPLLYGEQSAAFRRLQEELIRRSSDQSVFAWTAPETETTDSGMLAPSAEYFRHSGDVVNRSVQLSFPYAISNRGLEMTCPTIEVVYRSAIYDRTFENYIVELHCEHDDSNALFPGWEVATGAQRQIRFRGRRCVVVLGRLEGRSLYRRLRPSLESAILEDSLPGRVGERRERLKEFVVEDWKTPHEPVID